MNGLVGHIKAGIELVTSKELRAYLWLPLIGGVLLMAVLSMGLLLSLNTLVLAQLEYFGNQTYVTDYAWLDAALAWFASVSFWVLMVLMILVLLFAGNGILTILVHILIAPVMGLLAEKSLATLDDQLKLPEHGWSKLILDTLKRELRKVLYWLPRFLCLLLIWLLTFWIPVIGLLSSLFLAMFSAWMMAIQYLDMFAEIKGMSFHDSLKWIKQRKLKAFAFGVLIILAVAVPILNLVIIPIAVCTAADFWYKESLLLN